jgi:hypothetical protein
MLATNSKHFAEIYHGADPQWPGDHRACMVECHWPVVDDEATCWGGDNHIRHHDVLNQACASELI